MAKTKIYIFLFFYEIAKYSKKKHSLGDMLLILNKLQFSDSCKVIRTKEIFFVSQQKNRKINFEEEINIMKFLEF